jgi:methyl-accepting chemotaxis protein
MVKLPIAVPKISAGKENMTIRSKLVLAFFGLCFILIGGVAVLVVMETRRTALEHFRSSAEGQLLRIDDIFALYAHAGRRSAEYLAGLPILANAPGKVSNTFMDKKETTENRREMYNDYEKRIYDEFQKIQLGDPNYGLIFVGFSDGTFIEANEPGKANDSFAAGYDPRKRPWYTQAMEKEEDVNISLPYISTSMDVVCSVTSKVRDPSRNIIGVLAIDFKLSELTDYLAKLKIGRTGYVVALSRDGLVLANPAKPDTVFKNAGDPGGDKAFFERILSAGDAFFECAVEGKTYEALAHTNPDFGWRAAVLIERGEVLAGSVDARNKIIQLGLCLGVLALIAVFFLSHSMTLPITRLVDASGRIAEGDFDALPGRKGFSGEMLKLHGSLDRMVGRLSKLIENAEAATEEAERQSHSLNTIAREVARNSTRASDSAVETTQKAEQGAKMVSSLESAIAEVNRRSEMLTCAINDLSAQAQGIGRIMDVITGIANQTNLLALNAAVAAARAGESGKGFAVVADEVRGLAEKTRNATRDVGAAVDAIRKVTGESVANMEETVHSVRQSTELAATAQTALGEIVSLTRAMAEQIGSIAAVARTGSDSSRD